MQVRSKKVSSLKRHYHGLTERAKVKAREKIVEEIGFDQSTFYRRIETGIVPKLEQKVFAKHLNIPEESFSKN